MAVAPMLKVTVLGHASVMDAVIERLQAAGLLQITSHTSELPSIEVHPDDERRRVLEEYSADANFMRSFLARHHTCDAPFSSFVSEKFHMSTDDFEGFDDPVSMLPLYEQCEELADRTAALERERARLTGLVADLKPWQDVRVQIERWRGTAHVAVFAGTISSSNADAARAELRDVAAEVSVDDHGAQGARHAWIVMAHRDSVDAVRSVLATTDFTEITFDGLSDYPAEEIASALDRIAEVDVEIAALTEQATLLAQASYRDAVAMAESLDTERDSLLVREHFAETERTFVAEGWVAAAQREALEDSLATFAQVVDVTLSEPTEDDEPPVMLDNPAWMHAFEVLTDLYGRPRYRELDPTPLLAPFFLLFFSICISDVGYGAMLITGAYLIKHRLDVAPGVRRFMDLMMWGGAGAMVIGVAFGSYFAIPVEHLPPLLQSLQVFNPLVQITQFLIICVVLGVVQVFFGVLIAAYDAWRTGDRAGAVFGQLSTIFLFAMIGVTFVVPEYAAWTLSLGIVGTMLMQGDALLTALGESRRPLWDRAVGWAWLLAMFASIAMIATVSVTSGLALLAGACIVALVSHTGRRSVLALLGGAYAVYGMTAFIGDILSYTRLAALGLSGAMVGWVFNILTGLVWKPVAGMWESGGAGMIGAIVVGLMAAAVFVGGHTFNVVINLLGAFVHPARLQYVEFFSKFYEAGGRVFDPFRYKTKSVVLGAATVPAGQEGGAGS